MRGLSSSDILKAFEHGSQMTPPERALMLLRLSNGEAGDEDLAGLTIGQRDTNLLILRSRTLGPGLEGKTECPKCGEDLEFSLDIADLIPEEAIAPRERIIKLNQGKQEVTFRLPDSTDLLAIAQYREIETARNVLLKRCVIDFDSREDEETDEALPESLKTAVAEKMKDSDSLAEILLDLCCSECGHRWPMLLDINQFFWEEIADHAHRLIAVVVTLAETFGWSESAILAMTPLRRQWYLDQVT